MKGMVRLYTRQNHKFLNLNRTCLGSMVRGALFPFLVVVVMFGFLEDARIGFFTARKSRMRFLMKSTAVMPRSSTVFKSVAMHF